MIKINYKREVLTLYFDFTGENMKFVIDFVLILIFITFLLSFKDILENISLNFYEQYNYL